MVYLTCNNKKRHKPFTWDYKGKRKEDEFTSCPKCHGSVKIRAV